MNLSDEQSAYFWEDWWLDGLCIDEVAPRLYDKIRSRIYATKTVADAMAGAWPRDVGPDLCVEDFDEYLALSDMLSLVELRARIADVVRWAAKFAILTLLT